MAQYKVPQDVEADDKLLGPFNFRQFVYLMIAGGLIAVAAGLFQLFPLLAIIPLPPVLFFLALALPLKKDQPMETYLAALVSYYMKPRTRTWTPGQRETAIKITAPKKKEAARTRDITGEEATHRLSFLADIVDTEGYAIKGINNNTSMQASFVAESAGTKDMFEGNRFSNLATPIQRSENERHSELVEQMQNTINEAAPAPVVPTVAPEIPVAPPAPVATPAPVVPVEAPAPATTPVVAAPAAAPVAPAMDPVVVLPDLKTEEVVEKPVEKSVEKEGEERGIRAVQRKNIENKATNAANASIIDLMDNNKDYSVETLARQAKRIKGREEGEIFISLH